MPLKSDLTLDVNKFDPKRITEQTHKFNDQLIKIMEGGSVNHTIPVLMLQLRCRPHLLTPATGPGGGKSERRNTDKCGGMAKHPSPSP